MKLSKLLYVLMLMVWLPACSDSEEPAQTSDTCVGADTLQVGDETVCVISSELLVETGFSCPASHPNGHSYADMVVCSQGEMLPPGFFDEMEQAYPENTPEGPCQQVTCAIGEVCMGGTCDSETDAGSESIECIGVSRSPTGDLPQDLVGTWVTDIQYIDSYSKVVRLEADGTGQLINRPTDGRLEGPVDGSIQDTIWTVSGDLIDVEFFGSFDLWRMNPSTAQFTSSDFESGVTWYRVDCKGFGFGDEFDEAETGCSDCDSLDPPGTCLSHSDHWGSVSACGYETIPTDQMCAPDRYEPNDDVASATLFLQNRVEMDLGAPGLIDLSLCSGDVDVFTIEDPVGGMPTTLAAGGVIQVSALTFDQADDLTVELLDDSEAVVATAQPTNLEDPLRWYGLEYSVPADGTYHVRLQSAQDVDSMRLGILYRSDPTCTPDEYEPNDTRAEAATLDNTTGMQFQFNARVCGGNEDWYAIDLTAGQQLQLMGTHDWSEHLEMELFQGNNTVAVSDAFVGLPGSWSTAPFVAPATDTYYLRLWRATHSPDVFYFINYLVQ